MNELIKQLAERAGFGIGGGPPNQYIFAESYDGICDEEVEIFTQLIVQECLNQCYNRGMNDGLYAGQLQAAAYIEEHFGVEE